MRVATPVFGIGLGADDEETPYSVQREKVSGIKRHRAVDKQGLPHAIAVTTADVTDRAGTLVAFCEYQERLSAVTNLLVDGGYAGQPFADAVHNLLVATVTVAK